ncbi:hypothetical protein ACP4OV_025321 [Aristida adscensionis]
MASTVALVAALLVVAGGCAAVASATTYTVGDGKGWVVGPDYASWASDKAFAIGDTLVFNYPAKAHTVTEVSKSGYEACSGANALSDDDTGTTTITLTAPGAHYFICNVPGHCAAGMKLAITVSATPSPSVASAAAAIMQLPATTGAATAAAAAGAALIGLALL